MPRAPALSNEMDFMSAGMAGSICERSTAMTHWRWLAAGLTLTLATYGCGGGDAPSVSNDESSDVSAEATETAATDAPAKPKARDITDGPREALAVFLTAIKNGDDEKAASMLTELARQKTAENGMSVAPQGSDTASFKVTQAEMKGEDGAYVACTWSDVDTQGETTTDELVWVMSKQDADWRIAGMVAKVFPDMDAIVFNFEDPEDMNRKQEMAMQEMQRRTAAAEKAIAEATEPAPPAEETPATTPPKAGGGSARRGTGTQR
jgi:hypothetical protein